MGFHRRGRRVELPRGGALGDGFQAWFHACRARAFACLHSARSRLGLRTASVALAIASAAPAARLLALSRRRCVHLRFAYRLGGLRRRRLRFAPSLGATRAAITTFCALATRLTISARCLLRAPFAPVLSAAPSATLAAVTAFAASAPTFRALTTLTTLPTIAPLERRARLAAPFAPLGIAPARLFGGACGTRFTAACGRRRRRLCLLKMEPAQDPPDDSGARRRGNYRALGTRNRLAAWRAAFGRGLRHGRRRLRRRDAGHRGLLSFALRLARCGLGAGLFRHFDQLVARGHMLHLVELVVAQSLDAIVRRVEMRIRHQDDVDL